MRKLFLFIYLISLGATAESPYAGERLRDIKALSKAEIEAYRAGKGMGFAKAAELNHYPGPLHVLEIADKLKLDKMQLERTQAIYDEMKRQTSLRSANNW